MYYLTAYYRKEREGLPSLVLQQFICRKIPVCFLCVCNSTEFTKKMRIWSMNFPWTRYIGRFQMKWSQIQTALKQQISEIKQEKTEGEKDTADLNYTICLGVGNELSLLGNEMKVYHLSDEFGRGRVLPLSIGAGWNGRIETGAGLFLTYREDNAKYPIGNLFKIGEIQNEEQAEHRLAEYAENMRRGEEVGERDKNIDMADTEDKALMILLCAKE